MIFDEKTLLFVLVISAIGLVALGLGMLTYVQHRYIQRLERRIDQLEEFARAEDPKLYARIVANAATIAGQMNPAQAYG